MKASFFHDVRMIEGKCDKVYSVDFGYEVWQRYLEIFDEVTVCTRVDDNRDVNINKYKLSSGNNVKFKFNRQYKSPIQFFTQRNRITKPIKEVVEESEVCIIRLPSIIGVLAVKECIRQNKPWIAEVVGCCWDSLWNYGNIQGKILAPIMYLMNRYYIKKSSHVVYVSNEFLQKRYPSNGKKIGISDVNIQYEKKEVIESNINKQINDKDIVLGLIGSLNVEYKGHRTAIKAIKKLKDSGYNVRLECLGDGNKEKWIKLCRKLDVEGNVEFCGTLPSGDPVLQWLDKIDIFIMPSLQEGLPRSMVEAMSRGCNVIGSNTGGIPELIDDEFIFKRKNYKELANLVIKIVSDRDYAINQRRINFIKSQEYTKKITDNRRNEFWKSFKNDVQ